MIRLGADDLGAKGLFWLTVKTKVKVHARPKLMQTVTAGGFDVGVLHADGKAAVVARLLCGQM